MCFEYACVYVYVTYIDACTRFRWATIPSNVLFWPACIGTLYVSMYVCLDFCAYIYNRSFSCLRCLYIHLNNWCIKCRYISYAHMRYIYVNKMLARVCCTCFGCVVSSLVWPFQKQCTREWTWTICVCAKQCPHEWEWICMCMYVPTYIHTHIHLRRHGR
jgi:hypothetical protein